MTHCIPVPSRTLGTDGVADVTNNYTTLQKQYDSALQPSSKDEELLRSVKGGLTPRVRHLLQTGADIDCRDDTGLSALHIAVATGFEDVVDLLLQMGADPDALHLTAGTPLCLAASKERSHIIRKLIVARADINRAPARGATPLHWASFHGDTELLTILLRSGAHPLAIVDQRCMEGETPAATKTCPRIYARSALGLATERGHAECTRVLCQRGGVDSHAYLHGLGPLLYACLNGHLECVDLLLQHGVETNERESIDDDYQHDTYAILLTMQREQWPILRILVNAGARTDVRAGDGTESIVRMLLTRYTDPQQSTPWLSECPNEESRYNEFVHKVERVLKLISTTQLSSGLKRDPAVFETHIIFTAASTSANDLNDLLDLGADVNVTDYTGSTALHLAVTTGNPEATERLLKIGARTDVYHNIEEAPLWEAVSKRDCDIAELLLKHGANPDIANSDGRTLLHLVALQGHVEMIRALVKAGASVSARDHWSRTPLYLVDDEPSAEVLIELGADPSTSCDMPVQIFTKTREGVARVLVLGRYGTGKTTFINALIKSTKYCSGSRVAVVQSHLHGYRAEVDVIDTPGWDARPDYEVLKLIQSFLSEEYRSGRRLHCVVYMIDVGESRPGSHRRWIKVLEELVGPKALQSINFVFTQRVQKMCEDKNETKWIDAWERILPLGAKTWWFSLSGSPEDDLGKKSSELLHYATGTHTNHY
jgi:ankyrin repeat protein/GTP-binding protein EngB required for normal cell division